MATLYHFFLLLIIDVIAGPLSSPLRAHTGGGSHELFQPLNASRLGFQVNCFDKRRTPQDIQLKPIHYRDCIEAGRKVTFGDKTLAPMHFSRSPHLGMQVPEGWSSGTCAIRIDMKQQEDEDTFPLLDVANAASMLAERCSDFDRRSSGVGGLGYVGPKKVVMIFVYGQTPPPAPRPRPTILARADTT
ncbi:MAG: hypothetical protein Q9182_005057 [Xanthomendoza sp. 2 TL-2023]